MKPYRFALVVSALIAACVARAGVTTYTNETTFQNQGSIAFNTNWDSVPLDFFGVFHFPGDPFTAGDVTYSSTNNLMWGAGSGYSSSRTLIGNNFWTPIDGTINTAPAYDMFGFTIGTYGSSPLTFNIYTNANTYTYSSLAIANSANGQYEFRGFVASGGEYFTGFKITADYGSGNLPGITDVQVGNSGTQQVPDAGSSLMLLGAGLGFVAWLRRKRA